MATEIERKFLLAGDAWRLQCARQERIRDGLIATAAGRKVRVRAYDDRATLTVLAEVELPREDAEVPLPPWVGVEVTGRPEYKKRNMHAARRAAHAGARGAGLD